MDVGSCVEPVTLSAESAIFLRYPSFAGSDHLSRLQILGIKVKCAILLLEFRRGAHLPS